MALQNSIIDIHHHAIFQNLTENLELPKWSLESDQEAMERMGISCALLSLPISGPVNVVRKLNKVQPITRVLPIVGLNVGAIGYISYQFWFGLEVCYLAFCCYLHQKFFN